MSRPSSSSPRLGQPADGCLRQCRLLRRYLRARCRPWLALAAAPIELLAAATAQRPLEQICYLQATGRIDFVKLYELLNDLLW